MRQRGFQIQTKLQVRRPRRKEFRRAAAQLQNNGSRYAEMREEHFSEKVLFLFARMVKACAHIAKR